jgi:hypothetical protein
VKETMALVREMAAQVVAIRGEVGVLLRMA